MDQKNNWITLLTGIAIGIIAVAGIFLVYEGYASHREVSEKNVVENLTIDDKKNGEFATLVSTNTDALDDVVTVSARMVTGTDAFGSYTLWIDKNNGYTDNGYIQPTIKNYSENFASGTIRISWQKTFQPVASTTFVRMMNEFFPGYADISTCSGQYNTTDTDFCAGNMSVAGTISAPANLQGKTLYTVTFPWAEGADVGMGMGPSEGSILAFFDEHVHKLIYISADGNGGAWFADNKIISGFISYTFAELAPPSTIDIPGTASQLKLSNRSPFGGNPNKYTTYDAKEIAFVNTHIGPVYFHDKKFAIVMPNGDNYWYHLKPYFLKSITPSEAQKMLYADNYLTQIHWLDGRTDTVSDSYIPSVESYGGCGGSLFPDAGRVNEEPWFDVSKLIKVGQTDESEAVYEPSTVSSTNEAYSRLFENGYIGFLMNEDPLKTQTYDQASTKEQFATFIADHPVFFWKDTFGNWIMFQKAKYHAYAECGKPVIYLYPEKNMDVRVQVNPTGGFTVTDPVYGKNGWFVHAKTTGELFNYANSQTYPYLFWEGHSDGPTRPAAGFVWAKNEVEKNMHTTLEKLGLNVRETNDFLEFWLPKLTVKPYVFVTFIPQTDFNRMAPLTVTPKPDSVIRVFMDFEPLEVRKDVPVLSIKTPVRNGFTVVEWGGVLHY